MRYYYKVFLFTFFVIRFAFATEHDLMLITHASTPVTGLLSLQEIREIYLLKQLTWSDMTRIIVINRKSDTEVRRLFEQGLNLSSHKYALYLKKMHYQGIAVPLIQPSREAVLAFVAQTPGSVAYIKGALPPKYQHIKVVGYIQ